MFRCTTQILTRCRGQCALTWSTRRGPLSMTSQISLSLSCHRYWMNSGQVWVYLVQVWMQCVSSLSLQSLAKLVKHHKLIVMYMVPMAAKKNTARKQSKYICNACPCFKSILIMYFSCWPTQTPPIHWMGMLQPCTFTGQPHFTWDKICILLVFVLQTRGVQEEGGGVCEEVRHRGRPQGDW